MLFLKHVEPKLDIYGIGPLRTHHIDKQTANGEHFSSAARHSNGLIAWSGPTVISKFPRFELVELVVDWSENQQQ